MLRFARCQPSSSTALHEASYDRVKEICNKLEFSDKLMRRLEQVLGVTLAQPRCQQPFRGEQTNFKFLCQDSGPKKVPSGMTNSRTLDTDHTY